jgi:phosphoserine phosphatase RsbU/P
MPVSLRSLPRNYLFLVPVCAIAIVYQVGYTVAVLNDRLYGTQRAGEPLLSNAEDQITLNSNQAKKAGLENGERLLSIDGIPVKNAMSEDEILRGKRPGDSIQVVVQGLKDKVPTLHSFKLEPADWKRPTLAEWALDGLLLLISLLSVGIAVYVVLRLPHDPSAIFLFGVLVGMLQFIHMVNIWHLPRWASIGEACYQAVFQGTWPISMMLFGIYFPERSRWDEKLPWVKWLLIVPIAAFYAWSAIAIVAAHFSFSASIALQQPLDRFTGPLAVISLIAPCIFFAALGFKIPGTSSADAKRRLLILYAGSIVSLTPMFLLVLYVFIVKHGDFSGIPEWLDATIAIFLCGFPVTLAYVVLTQRASDLRVVIRQGIRYIFAKAGVRVLIAILVAAVLWGLSEAVFSTRASRPVQVTISVVCGVVAVLIARRLRMKTYAWVDRKFFREAYNAELILNDLNENIRTIIDEPKLLETVATTLSRSLHVPCVAMLLNTEGTLSAAYAVGCEAADEVQLPEAGFVVQQIRSVKEPPQIFFDVPANWIFEAPAEERDAIERLNSQLLLPVSVRDRLLGVFSLGAKRSEEPYSKTDIQLLRSLAFQTGLALENSRLASTVALEIARREKMNREIEIAREVQERLFPHDLPKLPGLDYFGSCRPALGVGGDYYDFIHLADGDIGIAVGDVSGKGIAAALLMASLQASLRGQALQGSKDLANVMSNVNRLVFDATPDNRYATFFYAQFERATRRLTYVNAGHNPPIVLRRIKGMTHVIRLDAGGPVVGLFREAPYQQASLTLEPGDILIGFTDGISEAMNIQDEEWGEERLLPALEACANQKAAEMIPSVMNAADRFVNGAPQHDDMTLVVMKLEAAA